MYGRGSTKVCNFVHVDEIWKDHVKLELAAQRKWPEKWGFLAKTYQELEDELFEIGEDQPDKDKSKESTKSKEMDSDVKALQKEKKPPPVPFPKTDSQLIGWRIQYDSPKPQKYYNTFGKKDIIKQLGWPREGC